MTQSTLDDMDSRSLDDIHKEARDLIQKIEEDLYVIDLAKDSLIDSLLEIDFGAHILSRMTPAWS